VDFINVWKFGEKKCSDCLCGEGNRIAWLSTLLTSHHIDLANQASNYIGALQKIMNLSSIVRECLLCAHTELIVCCVHIQQ
jgi:hypothetical protein